MPSDSKPMRFLADMGVAMGVVEYLRAQGHDVVHLRDEGLQRLPDKDIFTKAIAEARIVITFDLDFGEIAAAAGINCVSVVLFRLPHASTPYVIQRMTAALNATRDELPFGIIVTVEANRIRIRHLPIGK